MSEEMSDKRRPDGTFGAGNAANRGGNNPAFTRKVRGMLKGLLPGAVDVLKGALDGSLEGVTAKEQIQAAKIVVEFTIAKPKATLKVQGDAANPLAAFTPEQLLTLAGKKTEGESK